MARVRAVANRCVCSPPIESEWQGGRCPDCCAWGRSRRPDHAPLGKVQRFPLGRGREVTGSEHEAAR